jgi:uncharacterized membrane protein
MIGPLCRETETFASERCFWIKAIIWGDINRDRQPKHHASENPSRWRMTSQSALSQLLHGMTMLAFVIHIACGAIGLVSGTVAVFARKGGNLHRRAGTVFVASMLVMAIFAIYLGFVIPDQITNVFIGTFALYLVSTAWMTVRRKEGTSGIFEKFALFMALCLCAPFAILTFQLATGLPPLFTSAVPFKGPVLVAIYVFTTVLAIAVIGDTRVVLAGGLFGVARISRHLWRMCLGLSLAAGSGFTNGFARLLPGPYHVPTSFFMPQFLPLCLLVFWMIRVRFAGYRAP